MMACVNKVPINTLSSKLINYFSNEETTIILDTAIKNIFWTDGNIVIVCTDNKEKLFSVIAPDTYRKLLRYNKEEI